MSPSPNGDTKPRQPNRGVGHQ